MVINKVFSIMKLASLNNNSIDGELIVVSKNLKFFTSAQHISPTMQYALDNWAEVSKNLKKLYHNLNKDNVKKNIFDQTKVLSPLPRAYQWADGSAYVNHVSLVRQARGAMIPDSFWYDPLMYQGGSDDFTAPRSPILIQDEKFGIDFEAEVAVISDYVCMGSGLKTIDDKILLVMLANDVSLRNLIPQEINKGFGFYQSKPSTSFSPVAVTIDELGESWSKNKLFHIIRVDLNNKPFGRTETGIDMTFSFSDLILHASKTRNLRAGSIIGSGTVSNRDKNGGPGLPINEGGKGYACIAELRMVETIKYGKPKTKFLKFGDKVSIEVLDKSNQSVFGKIEQIVKNNR